MKKIKDEINLETFLFGGIVKIEGNQYNTRELEAFNDFTEFREETFKSFENFKGVVESLVSLFCWSNKDHCVVDLDYYSDNIHFNVPKIKILKKWYMEK